MRTYTGHSKPVAALAFSPDGTSLASLSGEPAVRAINPCSGAELWAGTAVGRANWMGSDLAFSPDGRWLATTENGGAQVREAATGRPAAFFGNPDREQFARWDSVAFTPDGRSLVTGGMVGVPAVRVIEWRDTGDWAVQRHVADGQGGSFIRLACGPDGDRLAAMHYAAVQVFDPSDDRPVWSVPANASHFVTALRVSPDGSRLAYAAGPELRVCDFRTGKLIASPRPSKKHIQGIAYSPDGRRLATVSNDATAILWDTARWVAAGEYTWKIGPLRSVAISPEGTLAAAGSDRGKIIVWDLEC